MTATTPTTPPTDDPFRVLRTDPVKCREGVWCKVPETGDELRLRRWACYEHQMASRDAAADYEKQHGKIEGEEAKLQVEAVATAHGLVVDWKLGDDPERKYDPAAMAAAFAHDEMHDLRVWLGREARLRDNFRPERFEE